MDYEDVDHLGLGLESVERCQRTQSQPKGKTPHHLQSPSARVYDIVQGVTKTV